MSGKLYGVGVGPGDPELMTQKAVRIIREADMIAVAGKGKNETIAYEIAKQVITDLNEKECLEMELPMIKDGETLKFYHEKASEQVIEKLQEGKNIAFLVLGDSTIYSTFLYIHKRVIAEGYSAEIINGVPSFCAAAARMNTGLVEREEMLHVIPASYPIEEAMKLPGTKVLMKAGSQLPKVKEIIKHTSEKVMMITNCGMKDECIYGNIEQLPDTAGYMSLLIVKE